MRLRNKIGIAIIGSGIAALGLFFSLRAPQPAVLTVHFLDIGQGDATLLRTPEGATILVDGGPDNNILHVLGAVMPMFTSTIDYLVITHSDVDHYGGLFSVIEQYDVREVLLASETDDDAYFNLLLDAMRAKHIPFRVVVPGDSIAWPSDVRLEFLWPPPAMQGSGNARSIVSMVTWEDREFLLTADIGVEEERALIRDYPAVRADVLKVGHHGSHTSSDVSFLQQMQPQFCIISAGAGNRYGHPHPTVMARLQNSSCVIAETAKAGTISFFHANGRTVVHTARSRL